MISSSCWYFLAGILAKNLPIRPLQKSSCQIKALEQTFSLEIRSLPPHLNASEIELEGNAMTYGSPSSENMFPKLQFFTLQHCQYQILLSQSVFVQLARWPNYCSV